jgi:hypothetical protein
VRGLFRLSTFQPNLILFFTGTGWRNCEWRHFEFTQDSTASDAHLTEVGNTQPKKDRPAGLDAHVIKEIEEVEKASG